jgi:hypothetical protein
MPSHAAHKAADADELVRLAESIFREIGAV